jgi:hypothetical protein
MINNQNDILTTGTLYWCKAGRRGSAPVPLEFLNEDQKQTLRSGLESDRYPLVRFSEMFNAHFIWVDEYGLYEVLVTDIDLSPETKRKLSPEKKVLESIPYRCTLSDMKRLQSEFVTGDVDETFVQDILSRLPWRPWEYAEWKSMRDLKIKDACENCGKSTDLVLQHTIQPRKVSSIIYDLVGNQYDEFQLYIENNKNLIELPLPENTKIVPVCPKCGSSRVRYRIRKGNYVCEKTRDYVICKYEFTTPDYGYDERLIEEAERKRRSLLRDKFCLEHGLSHKAIVVVLEEIITYLDLEHTKTLCNKCAFIEDKPYMK